MPTEMPAIPNPDIHGMIGLGATTATMLDPSRTDMRNVPHSDLPHPLGHNGDGDPATDPGMIAFTQAENRELRAEVDRLRADRDRLAGIHQQILDLLGTHNPDRLLHDLRNLLNERALFKALADTLPD